MKTLTRREVTPATGESLTALDRRLANPGIPHMHRERFEVQTSGNGHYLVAWENRLPVGYVLLHFRHPPHHRSYEHYPDCAYVEALDVSPKHRRQGFGVELMREAEARARSHGASLIGLSVGVENAPARALYEKLGYQPTEVPDYFVSWTYLDRDTGEPKEEGEVCSFWAKQLV